MRYGKLEKCDKYFFGKKKTLYEYVFRNMWGYDEAVEVSVFSSESQPYEIYVSYGRMYGVIYSNAEDAYAKLEEIKKVLEKEYKENKEPTDEFIEAFAEKYQLELPQDIIFDTSALFDLF